MKTTATNYETLIVIFAEPIRALDNASLKEWINGYESSRFTQTDERTAVITSEYNMTHVREWLERNADIDRLIINS